MIKPISIIGILIALLMASCGESKEVVVGEGENNQSQTDNRMEERNESNSSENGENNSNTPPIKMQTIQRVPSKNIRTIKE